MPIHRRCFFLPKTHNKFWALQKINMYQNCWSCNKNAHTHILWPWMSICLWVYDLFAWGHSAVSSSVIRCLQLSAAQSPEWGRVKSLSRPDTPAFSGQHLSETHPDTGVMRDTGQVNTSSIHFHTSYSVQSVSKVLTDFCWIMLSKNIWERNFTKSFICHYNTWIFYQIVNYMHT